NRVGHLFQNRYKSEPIEDERYLMVVLRYIHQNPIKAGIVKESAEYNWSSYNEYLKMYDSNNDLIDGEIMKAYFDSKKSFIEFHNQMSKENYMNYENINKYSDDIFYTGLVHISGVECNIPVEEYRDNHRVLVTEQDKLQNKEQIELLLKLGYAGNISFEPFSETIQEMEIEKIKSAINHSIKYVSK
ncbi:unnamed protein product, partial [marine sediment metagenome]